MNLKDHTPSPGSSPISQASDFSSQDDTPPSTRASSTDLCGAQHVLIPGLRARSAEDAKSFLLNVPIHVEGGEYVLLVLPDRDGRAPSLSDPVGYSRDVCGALGLRRSCCDKERLSYAKDHSDPVDGEADPLSVLGEAVGDVAMFAANKWTWLNRDEGKCMPGYFVTRENVNDEVIPSELPMKGSASDLILRFTTADALNLFSSSNLRSLFALPLPSISSTIYLLERPPFTFPPLFRDNNTNVHANTNTTTTTNPFGPPTVAEWQRIWNAWDFVTLRMIPPEMLHQKPIDLRHKCLFYIGHLPTFLDILLSKLLNEPYSEPKCFTTIFERGIDPHVDDPNHCHNHSDVPEADEDWPTLESILAYRDRVRARLMRLYDDIDTGKRRINRRIARVLQMTNEHEGFHVETLLYMLIQNAGCGTVPPPGFTTPPWELLAAQWNALPEPSTPKVILGPTKLVMGHDDSELADLEEPEAGVYEHVYGWDNESPRRVVEVGKFMIEWRPVTNGEFYEFWKAEGNEVVRMPRSWRLVDNEVFVLTLHGLVPLDIAQHWPVLTSFDDLTTYAKSKGGRIPTEPELRLFLDTYEVGHEGGANVAFRNWHPIPATTGIAENGGRGSNGGVWEWTSTVFDGHEGMAPTSLFPGYSSDFFDGKHQVVIGASYATIPSLAGRRTLRNFYQHNYPYPWVGARVAYDCV